jgi:malonyl CoA-acyl carrier protein transacylase
MQAFVFPGQGSQKRGMGQDLFDTVREFAAVESDVDAVLGYSLRRLCLEDPSSQLKETQFTQPSLYVVNALHYYQAIARGERPQFVAGHSLGEYNALLAAGVFDFLTGLKLVKRRGELMAREAGGAMAAVVGLSAEAIARVLVDASLTSIDVANFNSPSQIVISGPATAIDLAQTVFEKAGARIVVRLQVSAAFHSRYVAEAARQFAASLDGVQLQAPRIPVIANVTGKAYPSNVDAAGIKSLLVQQITRPVRWTQSVEHLLSQGVTQFKELGPGNVLTRLVEQIKQHERAQLAASPQ